MWLYSKENLPESRRAEFKALFGQELKVGRAWAIKEALRTLWECHSEGWARRFFRRWYSWATHARLTPIREVARTLKTHPDNIVTYCRHRVTNAVATEIPNTSRLLSTSSVAAWTYTHAKPGRTKKRSWTAIA